MCLPGSPLCKSASLTWIPANSLHFNLFFFLLQPKFLLILTAAEISTTFAYNTVDRVYTILCWTLLMSIWIFHSHFTSIRFKSIRFVTSLTFTDILIKFTTEAAAAAEARDLCWMRTWHFFSNSFGDILGRFVRGTKRFSPIIIEIKSRDGSTFGTRSVHNSHRFKSNQVLVTSLTQNALVQSNAILSSSICYFNGNIW